MNDNNNSSIMNTMLTQSNFKFSAVDVGALTSSEYTLVNIALDMSGSVGTYYKELTEAITTIIQACKKSDRAENLMIRIATFNNNVEELHGFKTLTTISADDYSQILSPTGTTALYSATIDAIETMEQYGHTLTDQEFEANGILFVITDGDNNVKSNSLSDVVDRFETLKFSESLESIQAFLIGVNTNNAYFKNKMDEFNNQVNFNEFIEIENATPESLAKLAKFVSKSISLQSQALGTGGPSQIIPSF
jgi:uncharacterized protein YegL